MLCVCLCMCTHVRANVQDHVKFSQAKWVLSGKGLRCPALSSRSPPFLYYNVAMEHGVPAESKFQWPGCVWHPLLFYTLLCFVGRGWYPYATALRWGSACLSLSSPSTTWVLRTQLRLVSAFTLWAILPVPRHGFLRQESCLSYCWFCSTHCYCWHLLSARR